MELDDHVCLCFRVSKRKLLNFAARTAPRVASQLSQCGGAGTGCGWCVPFLKLLFRQFSEAAAADPLGALTAAEYAARRAEYVKAGKGTPPPGAEPTGG
jgi:NAD(P)H-nitrite reductase large subunit